MYVYIWSYLSVLYINKYYIWLSLSLFLSLSIYIYKCIVYIHVNEHHGRLTWRLHILFKSPWHPRQRGDASPQRVCWCWIRGDNFLQRRCSLLYLKPSMAVGYFNEFRIDCSMGIQGSQEFFGLVMTKVFKWLTLHDSWFEWSLTDSITNGW